MNPSNFDDLTKALANSTSRRHAIRTIITASIGGLLGLTSIGTAFGKRRSKCFKNGHFCTQATECCSVNCQSNECVGLCGDSCNQHCQCPKGQPCVAGFCCPTDCCSQADCATGQRTCLSNGTCARKCVTPGECQNAGCAVGSDCNGRGLCENPPTTTGCSSDNDCPTGQLCGGFGFCADAC